MRDLRRRHQAARAGEQRPERVWEAVAVQALADDHDSAVKVVLAAAGLHSGGDRLARPRAVGGDYGLDPEQAAVLGPPGALHLGAVERQRHAGAPQRRVLVVRESLLVATERAAGVLLEERRGGGELEAGDRRRASR